MPTTFHRTEFAIVPSRDPHDQCESVLLITEEEASQFFHEVINTPREFILPLLLPDHPVSAKVLLTWPDDIRVKWSQLALGFHVNSSCLWRSRANHKDEFLSKVCGYKAFNYHLFDHWRKIATPSSLPYLRDYIKKNPSNFSGFFVIIAMIRDSPSMVPTAITVLDSLDLPTFVQKTEAYSDFISAISATVYENEGMDSLNALRVDNRFSNVINTLYYS